jgi:hypothetical protein
MKKVLIGCGTFAILSALLICTLSYWGCRKARTFLQDAKNREVQFRQTYGVPRNNIRKKVGLPVIGNTWDFANNGISEDHGYCSFYNPNRSNLEHVPVSIHRSKEIALTADKGLTESDTYYSTNIIKTVDGDFNQTLRITYSFNLANEGQNPWSCSIFQDPKGKGKYTLAEAETILKRWGLTRLNYEYRNPQD